MDEKDTSRHEVTRRRSSGRSGTDDPYDSAVRTRQQINDEATLARFGKEQKFKRNFRITSTVGLSAVVGLTWESVLGNLASLLIDGGPAGAFGEFIFVFFGTLTQALVMAELASMIPLSGGAYNWVSLLAPPRWSGFLSYITGWMTILAWQAIIAGFSYTGGQFIEAVIYLDDNTYNPLPWRGVLLYYAIILVAVIFNTVLSRLLPFIESTVLVIHILGFFVVIFLFGYLGPKNPASVVFGTFLNEGNWPTDALSFMVGSATAAAIFAGVDAASHLAEEVEDAAHVVPKAMILSILLNGLTGFGMLIAVLFAMGSPSQVLGHTAWYPILIPIFKTVTSSNAATTAIVAVLLVLTVSSAVAALTAGSRTIWAFAREDALPFSKYLAKVDKTFLLPLNAIAVSVVISLLLALLILGSSVVFTAFIGVIIATFYSTYFLVSALSFYRRYWPERSEIEWGPFYLGRWGGPLAVLSMMYSFIGWFFSFWPPATPVNANSFNYSVVIYMGVLILAVGWWLIRASRLYKGPKLPGLP